MWIVSNKELRYGGTIEADTLRKTINYNTHITLPRFKDGSMMISKCLFFG